MSHTGSFYSEEVVRVLLEENKKLVGEIKKLQEENEDNLASLNFYTEQCAELKDERKKLKEENKKLNEMIPTGTVYSENVIVEYQQKVKLLEGENKKLQEELNEESQERLKNKECWMSVQKQYHELKEESKVDKEFQEEIMQRNKKLEWDYDIRGDIGKGLVETIEKLKEEKEALCNFLGGNYNDYIHAVEEILKGFYSEDFIKANQETWNQVGLFEEDSDDPDEE